MPDRHDDQPDLGGAVNYVDILSDQKPLFRVNHPAATDHGPCPWPGNNGAHHQDIVNNIGICECGYRQVYSATAGYAPINPTRHTGRRAATRLRNSTATLRAMDVGMVREVDHSDGVCNYMTGVSARHQRCSVLQTARQMDQHSPWHYRVHHTQRYMATVWKLDGVRPKGVG